MAKPKIRPEKSPAQAGGEQGARSYQALYRQYQPIGAGLPPGEVQACRADPRLVLVNVKRGVAAVLGTKEQVKAVREHLPRIAVDVENSGQPQRPALLVLPGMNDDVEEYDNRVVPVRIL
ncbi:hypothetical protein WMF26_20785 [Sorangium sp. So ce185]|uniref:hypothetical protein n=1 Tax=Sorangium sp. So ce185 TaxID=3133287 RepID=UPI003F6021D6